ncbi:MAG: hypothetical protein HWE20_09205 [Gammaproteobacteria bacterium]|nr:hypothetical protein [Gammaproteobacteria bacterium]
MYRMICTIGLISLMACSTLPPENMTPNAVRPPAHWLESSANTPVAPTPKPKLRDKHISLTAQKISLNQLFAKLGQMTGIDIEQSVDLPQLVSVAYREQALDTVIDLLAMQHDFVSVWDGDRLLLLPAGDYSEIYRLPLMPTIRDFSARLGTRSSEISELENAEIGGSDSVITTEAKADPWQEILAGIQQLAPGKPVNLQPHNSMVLVNASKREHREIERYLSQLTERSAQQVLIDAAVVEIRLESSERSGIDWQSLTEGAGLTLVQNLTGFNPLETSPNSAAIYRQTHSGSVLTLALQSLQNQGQVRVLSNPRLRVLNNQSALMKVVDEHVFFTQEIEETFDDEGQVARRRLQTDIGRIPVGLTLQVLATIAEGGRISLQLRPTLSRVKGVRELPLFEDQRPLVNEVPELQVRELETVVSVQSGETIVLGGMMADDLSTRRKGLSGLPLQRGIGKWLGASDQARQQTELVIFLKPRVIGHVAR